MLDKTLQLYKDSFGGLSKEVWLLATVMFINRAGTMVIIFLMIYLTEQLNFTLTEAGMVMSCFGMGSLLGSYIGGWLTDRIGYFYVMFWSMFLGGIGFFFLIPLESFWAWCVGVTLLTAISDCFRPANLTAIGIYSKDENRTRSLSLLRVAINMGLGLGPAIGGLVAMAWGYNLLFVLDGMTCILSALFFFFLLPKKEVNKKEQSKEEKALEYASAQSAYKDAFFLKFLFCVFLIMIVFMHIFNVLTTYWKEHFLLTEEHVGYLLAINGLIIGAFEMPAVYILEKKYKIFPLIIIGAILIGISYTMFIFFDFWIGTVIISLLAITIGEVINFPFLNTVALNRAPAARRGQYMGLYGISFSLALIIAPTFGGKIAEVWGYNTLWIVLTVISILSILGFYSLQKEYEESIKAEKKELELV